MVMQTSANLVPPLDFNTDVRLSEKTSCQKIYGQIIGASVKRKASTLEHRGAAGPTVSMKPRGLSAERALITKEPPASQAAQSAQAQREPAVKSRCRVESRAVQATLRAGAELDRRRAGLDADILRWTGRNSDRLNLDRLIPPRGWRAGGETPGPCPLHTGTGRSWPYDARPSGLGLVLRTAGLVTPDSGVHVR